MHCAGGGESVSDLHQHGISQGYFFGAKALGWRVENELSAHLRSDKKKKYYATSTDRVSGAAAWRIRTSAGKGLERGNIAKHWKIRYNFVTIL